MMKSMVTPANIPVAGTIMSGKCYPTPDGQEDFALIADYGDQIPLVRIHSECLTGDVFGSQRCDCGQQLSMALEQIRHEGGVFIYLRQEGRGIGLLEKMKAYILQDNANLDTVDANIKLGHPIDGRCYDRAIRILQDLNIDAIRLLTNNPQKVKEVEQSNIRVIEIIPCRTSENTYNKAYLETKRHRMEHLL
jgi:3,4-dihydroxy 2-butanone 4-phosphate synthase / GTP cyclohydrolase II